MSKLIDLKSHPVEVTLNILLKDRTTEKNIIFATEAYEGVDFTTEITRRILLSNSLDIRPRVLKSLEEQTQRTRKKAEVFTPAWICNKMNNRCDVDWFGRKNVFNTEQPQGWLSTTEKIQFPVGKNWKDYVVSTRLEITCGEAPYLVSRYDAATGEIIPIDQRIGILDRKLRVINENTKNRNTWKQWVYRAFESVYGYEFQGDNLLIARINLLETFCEYTMQRWNEMPTDSELKRIARIISWNLWQMDGIHGVIPYKGAVTMEPDENEPYQMTVFDFMELGSQFEQVDDEVETLPEITKCKIYDWQANKIILYNNSRNGRKE